MEEKEVRLVDNVESFDQNVALHYALSAKTQ
jgi:hypothetical protein